VALLEFTNKGIYCPPAQVYIDPWRPVDKALITHGHADHSRWGMKKYISTHAAKPVIQHRLGDIDISGVDYGEELRINGVKFSFHPAGHLIGSAQIRVEHKGEVWVASGDYKTEADGVSETFEPVPCHTFITECTFGLPVFRWKAQAEVMEEIAQWWRKNQAQGITSVLVAYSLGKAQRVIQNLPDDVGPIFTQGAVENINEVLRGQGIPIRPSTRVTKDLDKKETKGGLVIGPNSIIGSPWLRRFAPFEIGMVSGWMAMRGGRRRRAMDRGFVLSDHADWDGLLDTIKATGCERVITTHGYTDIFAQYLREQGWDAITEKTEFEGESIDTKEEEGGT
jgi:putative mRNA 3-end processing factor